MQPRDNIVVLTVLILDLGWVGYSMARHTPASGTQLYRGGLEGELVRTRNRLLTLEQDFNAIQSERSRTDELRATLAKSFTVSAGPSESSLRIHWPSFASDASIFTVDEVESVDANTSENVYRRTLLAVKPPVFGGQFVDVSVPPRSQPVTHVCISLETFNVLLEDVKYSTELFGEPSRRDQDRGCRRFSVSVSRRIGCVTVKANTSAGSKRVCSFTSFTHGHWANPRAFHTRKV